MPFSRASVAAAPCTVVAAGVSLAPVTLTAMSAAARPAATSGTPRGRRFFERVDTAQPRLGSPARANIGACYRTTSVGTTDLDPALRRKAETMSVAVDHVRDVILRGGTT